MSKINLSYIKPKNTLQTAEHKTVLLTSIVAKVKEIEDHGALKFDNELLIFVCSCIENALESKKVDKKHLALEIYSALFELSADDLKIIGTSIDFLCNNKLVKRIPSITKYCRMFENYIVNKL